MKMMLILFMTACTTTSYPTAPETLAVFDSGEIKTCNDTIEPILKNLASEGWQVSKPILREDSAFVPFIKGDFTKLVLIVSTSKRWNYPETVEHVGTCISGAEHLGYVMVDTFKTKVSQHIEEDSTLIQIRN